MKKSLGEIVSEALGQEIGYQVEGKLEELLEKVSSDMAETKLKAEIHDFRPLSYCANVPSGQRQFADMLVKAGLLYKEATHLYGITINGRACLFDIWVDRAHNRHGYRQYLT